MNLTPLHSQFALAQRLHQAGDLARAEQLYRQILDREPKHALALGALGLLAFQQGQHTRAIELLGEACTLSPEEPMLANNLGLAYKSAGRIGEAIASFRQALQQAPAFAEAHANLGSALKEQGDASQAISHLRRAVELQPNHSGMLYTLGNALQQDSNLTEALACYDGALARKPDFVAAWNNRGLVLQRMGQDDEAQGSYETALRHQPTFVDALVNLGLLRKQQKNLAEAATWWRRAAQLAPGRASIQRDLGNLLQELGKWHEAVDVLRIASQLEPGDVETHNSLALGLCKLGALDEAAAHCQEALRLKPECVEAHNNLGAALIEQGLLAEALASYQSAVRLQPEWEGARSNVLLALNYFPEAEPSWLCDQHAAWGRRFSKAEAVTSPAGPDPKRRLRIGYLSPDFRLHPVAHFIEPVLAAHDPQSFEIYGYAEVAVADAVTARLSSLTAQWQFTNALDDAALADRIRRDAIDILVDLAGHTGGNRLPMFALRPAPIQVTWLGYPNTTGLPAMDYRLTDAIADPPDESPCHTEELVRLPDCFCCFAIPDYFPPVSPLPALTKGHFTFGSFHNLAKINAGVLDVWCEVLRALPASRLLMFRNTLNGSSAARLRQQFAQHGIAPERIELRHEAHGDWGYLKVYHDMDLVLDAWPWSGHTTTCEGLWMGVPALTLPGNRHAGRMTATILTHVGLKDWIANTSEDFVRRAVHWAHAREELAGLRSELRSRIRGSALCDGAAFTQGLEECYRRMWRTWCDNQSMGRPLR